MNITETKELWGLAAVIVGFVGYVPYFIGMARGDVKPHVFSWLIFALIMTVTYCVQDAAGSGAGAWVTGATAVVAFIIAVAAVFYGEQTITRTDWAAFIGALAAVPLWILTDTPVWSVALIITIDCFAMFPTFRKSWNKPYEEPLSTYILCAVKYLMTLPALTQFDAVAMAYPLFLIALNIALIVFLMARRFAISNTAAA